MSQKWGFPPEHLSPFLGSNRYVCKVLSMKRNIFFIMLFLMGCSSISSLFDDTYLVWKMGMDIDKVKTPPGFTITPKEVHGVIPLTKFKWNIYADRANYYISSGVQKMISKTGDNSALAKANGYKIGGSDRILYEKLIKAKEPYNHLSTEQLRKIIDKHNAETSTAWTADRESYAIFR